jgi:hypothetical protein
VVGAAAGKKVAEIVNKGVSFVADVAKSAVRTVCEGVQSAGRKIASWLGF